MIGKTDALERYGGLTIVGVRIVAIASVYLTLVVVGMRYQLGPLGFVLFSPEIFVIVAFELAVAFAIGFVVSLVFEVLVLAIISCFDGSGAVDSWVSVLSMLVRLIVAILIFAPAILKEIAWGSNLASVTFIVAPLLLSVFLATLFGDFCRGKEIPKVWIVFTLLLPLPSAIALGSARIQSASFGPTVYVTTNSSELRVQPVLQLSAGWVFLNPRQQTYFFLASNQAVKIVPDETDSGLHLGDDNFLLTRIVKALAGRF